MQSLRSVAWNGNKLVAAGFGGTILTSPNGINWTAQNTGTLNSLSSVIWTGNHFEAFSDNISLTSRDGVTWIQQGSGTTSVVGSTSTGAVPMARNIAGKKNPSSLRWTGKLLVGIREGIIVTSPDGINYTERTSLKRGILNGQTFNGKLLVAVGNDGLVLTSSDGVKWTTQHSGTTKSLESITYTGTQFWAVGLSGIVLFSPDGTTWSGGSLGVSPNLYSVVFAGRQLVAVGDLGTILTLN